MVSKLAHGMRWLHSVASVTIFRFSQTEGCSDFETHFVTASSPRLHGQSEHLQRSLHLRNPQRESGSLGKRHETSRGPPEITPDDSTYLTCLLCTCFLFRLLAWEQALLCPSLSCEVSLCRGQPSQPAAQLSAKNQCTLPAASDLNRDSAVESSGVFPETQLRLRTWAR